MPSFAAPRPGSGGEETVERTDGDAAAPTQRGRNRAAAVGRVLALVVAAVAGSVLAVSLVGHVPARVGPFDTTMSARPLTGGGTEVRLAPLGRMDFDSHGGPLGLSVTLDELREAEARAIAEDPEDFRLDEAALARDVRDGIRRLAVRAALAAVGGAALLGLLWGRRWRDGLVGALVGLVVAASSMAVARQTWEPESLAQPRYSGLLTLAPQAIGDARDVVDRFTDYQAQLAGLIENVAVLYRSANEIRSFQPDDSTVRVLHVSDLHLNPQGFELIETLAEQFAIDVVVDTGDINDWGTPFEARYADLIAEVPAPYLYIRGNHDSAVTARAVARQPNAVVLDGDSTTVAGLTFWGDGDPRFTPDKSAADEGQDTKEDMVEAEAPKLAGRVRAAGPEDLDVVLVHDPAVADELGGTVPLVLAGHRHRSDRIDLGDGTLLLVEGSTGGAGLRGLQGTRPVPLSASVLYFDAGTGALEAMDRIVVAGLDQSDVRIERELLDPVPAGRDGEDDDGTEPDEPPGEPPAGEGDGPAAGAGTAPDGVTSTAPPTTGAPGTTDRPGDAGG